MKKLVYIIRRLLYIIVPPIAVILFLTLFDQGADFNCIFDKTLHHKHEEKKSWSCLHFSAAEGDVARVLSMLADGSDIEAISEEGKTPIYEAAKAGMITTVKALAEHGANLGARSFNSEFTPLHVAAEYNHHNVVSYLLVQGVPVDTRNRWLQTPLSQASWRFADARMIDLLMNRGADPNSMDEKGYTPLHRAAGNKKTAILRALVAGCADLDIEANRSYTALMYAAYKGNYEAVSILLNAGATINKTPGSNSALNQAKLNGHDEIVELLLEYGAIDTKKSLSSIKAEFDFYENENYPEALVKLNNLIRVEPDNYMAYYYRGRTNEKLKELDLALKDLLTTEKLKPNHKDTQEIIAWLYLQKKITTTVLNITQRL